MGALCFRGGAGRRGCCQGSCGRLQGPHPRSPSPHCTAPVRHSLGRRCRRRGGVHSRRRGRGRERGMLADCSSAVARRQHCWRSHGVQACSARGSGRRRCPPCCSQKAFPICWDCRKPPQDPGLIRLVGMHALTPVHERHLHNCCTCAKWERPVIWSLWSGRCEACSAVHVFEDPYSCILDCRALRTPYRMAVAMRISVTGWHVPVLELVIGTTTDDTVVRNLACSPDCIHELGSCDYSQAWLTRYLKTLQSLCCLFMQFTGFLCATSPQYCHAVDGPRHQLSEFILLLSLSFGTGNARHPTGCRH